MSWRVNSKVFETEDEARKFSKDLQAYGGLGGWVETSDPVTHYYLGDLLTEKKRADVVKAIMNNKGVGLPDASRLEKAMTDAERKAEVEKYISYGGRV